MKITTRVGPWRLTVFRFPFSRPRVRHGTNWGSITYAGWSFTWERNTSASGRWVYWRWLWTWRRANRARERGDAP